LTLYHPLINNIYARIKPVVQCCEFGYTIYNNTRCASLQCEPERVFLFMPTIYNKLALTVDQQIDLLESRGLIVPDRDKARHYLQFINYYRLSGYTISFEKIINGKRDHQFKPGTHFDDILNLYDFDRQLRTLVMDAIERIEVAVRAQICLSLATTYNDSHWHLRRELFKPDYKYYSLLSKCEMEQQKSKELFATHYKSTYDMPVL
jgi:abortive infection bacteriophage resistance protein